MNGCLFLIADTQKWEYISDKYLYLVYLVKIWLLYFIQILSVSTILDYEPIHFFPPLANYPKPIQAQTNFHAFSTLISARHEIGKLEWKENHRGRDFVWLNRLDHTGQEYLRNIYQAFQLFQG